MEKTLTYRGADNREWQPPRLDLGPDESLVIENQTGESAVFVIARPARGNRDIAFARIVGAAARETVDALPAGEFQVIEVSEAQRVSATVRVQG